MVSRGLGWVWTGGTDLGAREKPHACGKAGRHVPPTSSESALIGGHSNSTSQELEPKGGGYCHERLATQPTATAHRMMIGDHMDVGDGMVMEVCMDM
jgi:hypothetical protein